MAGHRRFSARRLPGVIDVQDVRSATAPTRRRRPPRRTAPQGEEAGEPDQDVTDPRRTAVGQGRVLG
ncbi:hypothetical protein QJS66_04850 [Kocuria rhizophila]|nr:hypothetical protein QJS66_04850 [Kocuria rhizophila]